MTINLTVQQTIDATNLLSKLRAENAEARRKHRCDQEGQRANTVHPQEKRQARCGSHG